MIKPVYNIPHCENLTLILNRAALSLMLCHDVKYSHDVLKGHDVRNKKSLSILLNYGRHLIADGVYDVLADYYVYNDFRFEYVFILVKCGKCACCRHAKQIDLINRVQMESSCYDCPVYMITLTYSERYLPCHRPELRRRGILANTLYYKDVQDFFKRLRIRWTRAGLHHDIRYMVCGEYGKKGRPHYHILLWNNPYKCSDVRNYSPFINNTSILLNHRKFCDDVFESWGMCQRQAFQCEVAGEGAGAYVSKYITKQTMYKLKKRFGFVPPFIRASSRHGGIGAPAVSRALDYYRKNPSLHDFTYRSFDGSIKQVRITSFISQKLFPSSSRQIPASYKDLFRSLVHCTHQAYNYDLISKDAIQSLLDTYSLGLLSYTIELDNFVIHDKTSIYDFSRSRVASCLFSLIDDLQSYYPHLSVDLSAYTIYKYTKPADLTLRDFAQRTFSINNYISFQDSKELL